MDKYKILNIKGAVLDKYQLENYLEKMASDNVLKDKSAKNTYPIPRLKENFNYITNVYKMLSEHLKLEIPIHPAGEWILDNYYIIEKSVKTIIKDLSLKKYISFLGIDNGNYKGFARIYVLASEIVAYTDAKIDRDNLSDLLRAYQKKKNLSMDEIWNIGLFLQIAVIENIRMICEKIYSSQVQKYKVENIIERLVENKEVLKFKNVPVNKKVEYGEMKYPFIEYMSYRLKQYGKKGYSFLNVLENEVDKMGLTIEEVIQKEHFDVALKKVSMGNSITSINTITRVNFLQIFEEINGVEEVLKKDPVDAYSKMDYKTRAYYRNVIAKISKKTKISEIYIAKKCLELANNNFYNNKSNEENKKAHIGYYLISDGKEELLSQLLNKKITKVSIKQKINFYIYGIIFLSVIISLLCGFYVYKQSENLIFSLFIFILSIVPSQAIITQLIQYILSIIIKPKMLPKLDYKSGIPKESTTMVIIPTIVKNAEKVRELFKKLEVYYIANKSENLYFTLLGDCSSGDKAKEKFDEEIINEGIKQIEILNKKYPDSNFNKFNFIYRKRIWNESEESYLGWERKRGLINQFNEYILGNMKNPFLYNSFEEKNDFIIEDFNIKEKNNTENNIENNTEKIKQKLKEIKYIITLDSDTDLVLNSGLELIGCMSHILNKPVLDKNKNVVISGYGIMQPRVGIGLLEVQKSIFTKIFAGLGGTDSYVNAVFDVYQDNFKEGIFTGKGIYDLRVFSKVLKNEIPENKVLSHDLLEGCYLKCGMVSDVMLMDGYPSNYLASKKRNHRWIRGDYQILGWLKNKKLNKLSKYKIIDNIFRSKLDYYILFIFLFSIIFNCFNDSNILPIILFGFISLLIPYILEILNKIINKKDGEIKQKTFVNNASTIQKSLMKMFLGIASLPDKAYTAISAECTSLYRMCISKKHLLEWVTAEEAEKSLKNSLKAYVKGMVPNIILGILVIIFAFFANSKILQIIAYLIGIIWLNGPFIMYYISQNIKEKNPLQELSEEEQNYILNIANKTWLFFKEHINTETNFLPPDNYQEDRKPKVVMRTSSTNIGLGLLSVISSYDLKFETLENTINLLEKMFTTINSLSKWNGHLYNWYNIENLEPLNPKYVSSVDSGNFIGYLYVIKQFLENIKNSDFNKLENLKSNNLINNNYENDKKFETSIKEKSNILIQQINLIIENTDFTKLFDEKNNLLSIGFDVEENKLTDSYYDLLASEARQASLVAIAKKDIDVKNWYNLSRTLTILNRYKGLISWSGTAFEYLMPNINIPKYPGSLLDESCKFSIMSQKSYAKKLGIPWGISESAFNLKDLNANYQYKAFGIPWLGLKRGLADEMVVSSYGSILAINDVPKDVISNLKKLEKYGMNDKYGFYEAIDFTPNRVEKNKNYANVKTYMAHHQGLILLSINNLFNNNILQKRFMKNPELQAVNILLEEKMPENVIITKEKKEKIEKIKYSNYDFYSEKTFNKLSNNLERFNLISNKNYSIILDEKGNGYSKYKNILVNRYKRTSDINEGIYFYLKNVKNKKIWTNSFIQNTDKPDKYVVTFSQDVSKFVRLDGNIETTTKITVSPEDSVEIRNLKIKNLGNIDETLEISSILEPVLSSKDQDYAHPAFNNLFLTFEFLEDMNTILVKRKARFESQKEIFMGVTLITDDYTSKEMEYEINKEKLIERNNFGIPKLIENSKPFSKKIELVTDPIIALRRTVNIKAKECINLNLVVCVSEDKEYVLKKIKKYNNFENNKRIFELSRARVEAENRYLNINSKEINLYQNLLNYILGINICNIKYNLNLDESYPVQELWKYGISGDLPIISVKIKSINDINVIQQLLKAYEYFLSKNVEFDLVIINEEKENYDTYVKDSVYEVILNSKLEHRLNIKAGIFLLNNLKEKDKKLISIYSKLFLDSKNGELSLQLKDLEEDIPKNYIEDRKEILELQEEPKQESLIDINKLLYYNEFGGFTEDGKEYIFKINKENNTPAPWSNIMANENFGTLVTESCGGYSWYKNSRLNRISAWSNNQILDIPSEVIYLKDEESKKAWSVGLNPMPDSNDYYITYGFGYSKFNHCSCGINQELEIFVPKEDSVKVQILRLKNLLPKKRKIKIVYYLKPVLGEDEIKTSELLNVKFNKNNNIIFAKNISNIDYNNLIFISSSEKIKSYTCSKKEFFGNGNISNPYGLKLDNFSNNLWNKMSNIIAIELEIELEALENKEISIIMGAAPKELAAQDLAYKYSNLANCATENKIVRKYWLELLNNLQVKTPIVSMNILLNGWVMYQTIVSRLIGRTGYYQSGGAFGFRDQLQDSLSTKYLNPEITKNQIIKHSMHQFIEGDVEHWWHEETGRGIRTRFSDDLLWLPYLVADYIAFTGDYSILDIETNYLQGPLLEDGCDEKYDKYVSSNIKENIFMHCIRAIEKSLDFGENGLPKIGSGDWNDGFSTVGNKGKGESVWLGFFLCSVLEKFVKICKYVEEKSLNNIVINLDSNVQNGEIGSTKAEKSAENVDKLSEKYQIIVNNLRKSLNTNAWDGRWFKRAFMDDGNVLGSIQNEECKIDSIAQSWSVISNMGDNDKKYIAMESLENHLVDKENGIIKLLDPPFEKSNLEPGYIKAYIPGTRENGGQYTHAAIWVIIAESMLGFGNKATELFNMINPIEHSKSKLAVTKYKVEPYVIPGDVYGQNNLAGRGGWTWYTGSSSWMYIAGIEYILGIKIKDGFLTINPVIPEDWKEFSVQYKCGETVYNIKYENDNSKDKKVFVNDEEILDGKIKINNDGRIYNVLVQN